MTWNKDAFARLSSFDQPIEIKSISFSYGDCLEVCGFGDVELSTARGIVILRDVLWVPEIATNVFSVPDILGNGLNYVEEGKRMTFLRDDLTLLTATTESNDLFCLDVDVNVASTVSLPGQRTPIYGHTGSTYCTTYGDLVRSDCMDEDVMQDEPVDVGAHRACETYLWGDANCGTDASSYCTLHADVQGPFECGPENHYVVTCVLVHNEAQLGFAALVPNRVTATTFTQLIADHADMTFGMPVQRICTDDMEEFSDDFFETWCFDKGVTHEFTCCDAVIEHFNDAVFDTMGAAFATGIDYAHTAEVLMYAVHAFNMRVPPAATVTRYETFYKMAPAQQLQHAFGTPVLVTPSGTAAAVRGILVGYQPPFGPLAQSPGCLAYRVLVDDEVVVATDVSFTCGSCPVSGTGSGGSVALGCASAGCMGVSREGGVRQSAPLDTPSTPAHVHQDLVHGVIGNDAVTPLDDDVPDVSTAGTTVPLMESVHMQSPLTEDTEDHLWAERLCDGAALAAFAAQTVPVLSRCSKVQQAIWEIPGGCGTVRSSYGLMRKRRKYKARGACIAPRWRRSRFRRTPHCAQRVSSPSIVTAPCWRRNQSRRTLLCAQRALSPCAYAASRRRRSRSLRTLRAFSPGACTTQRWLGSSSRRTLRCAQRTFHTASRRRCSRSRRTSVSRLSRALISRHLLSHPLPQPDGHLTLTTPHHLFPPLSFMADTGVCSLLFPSVVRVWAGKLAPD